MAKRTSKGHDIAKCRVCNHADYVLIEQLYLRGEPRAEICRQFGLKTDHFQKHIVAKELDVKWVKNSYSTLARIARAKLEDLNPEDISVKDLIEIMKHVDKREGRIIQKHEVAKTPEVVYVQAFPNPGQPLAPLGASTKADPLLIEGELVGEEEKEGS